MLKKNLNILIVDDSPEDREMIRRYLARGANQLYTFLEANMACEGLDIFKKHDPDCVLLDYHLPDMTGLEFLAKLKEITNSTALPVVMLTGAGSETIAVEAMKSGAKDYLVKGCITAGSLRRAVHYAVEKTEMLRQLMDQHRQLEQKNRELEEKNRELEEADRRKNEFLAMLAHELRNPLAAITNALYILPQANPGGDRWRQAWEVLQRQVHHQSRLLDELLEVSRIIRGKILLRYERLDLAALLQDAVEDAWTMMESVGIHLLLDVPPEPVRIDGDSVRLTQVLGNLLSNSCKFTDEGGQVLVHLEQDKAKKQAVISIRDTGIGISPEMLPHLFETFAQADRTLDRSQGGLGLGLSLVKGLVEYHGGEVEAFSDGVDQGAEFRITLPLAECTETIREGEQPVPKLTGAVDTSTAVSPLRILIIEDNKDAADTFRDLLEIVGHQVQVAYSGPSGLHTAASFHPDVVLCDLGLPGMDGYSLAAAFRRDPLLKSIPLIAVSGYGQEDDRRRSSEAGFDFHLTKPVDLKDLQRLLDRTVKESVN